MASKWTDRMATPKIDPSRSENISELFMDSSKINVMRLLNCDEKYKKEKAADFELLREWERCLPLCQGNGAAAIYEAETRWLGVEDMALSDRWTVGCERLRDMDLSEYSAPTDQLRIDRFVSDFVKGSADEAEPLTSLIERMGAVAEASKDKDFHLILPLSEAPLLRPNLHAAEQILKREISGEKCNGSERSLLLLQSLISLVRLIGEKKKFVLHIYAEGAYDPVFDAIEYLGDRKLFEGEIYVGVFLDTAVRAHSELCRLFAERSDGRQLTLHTELILTVADFADDLSDRLAGLFRLYPRKGICFGGVLTDSPAYFVADRIALDAWRKSDPAF